MIDFKEKIRQYSEKSENEVLQYLFNYWGFEISEQPFKLIVGNYEKSIKPDKNGNEFGFFQEVRPMQFKTLTSAVNTGEPGSVLVMVVGNATGAPKSM